MPETIMDRLKRKRQGFGRDKSGNVLMIAAAALFPLLAIIGSGVDIGRAYMTNLRLQQACDAGVLAGRRAMAGGLYGDEPKAEAAKLFYFNFPANLYGTQELLFVSSASGSADVVGSASAELPTSVMHIFGFNNFDLSVDCGAKLEIANTDVMMVLDTTGSMGSGRNSKIEGLKSASNEFLDTISKADVGDGRIRIGVVPYALTVNVGAILMDANPDWVSDTANIPTLTYTSGNSNSSNVTYMRTNVNYTVSRLKNFKSSGTGFNIGRRGDEVSIAWGGCITEVKTTAFSSTSTAPAAAWDVKIDHIPTSSDDTSKWKMYLPELANVRNGSGNTSTTIPRNTYPKDYYTGSGNSRVYPLRSFEEAGGDSSGCPVAAMELTDMTASGRTRFRNKIDSLSSHGFTYHDAGMAWGGRLLSPTGIMKSKNELAPNGKPISRHLIFMTDGNMDTGRARYSHQGVEQIIARVGSSSETDSDDRHINRFKQLCTDIRSKGMTIWVVAFGFPAPSSRNAAQRASFQNLQTCADSADRMFDAATNADLGASFVAIAGQISRLRVSQ